MTIWDRNEQNGLSFEGPPIAHYYAHAYRLVGVYNEKFKQLRRTLLGDVTSKVLDEFSILHCEILLFACMTVEAILNYVGFLMRRVF